MRVDHDITVTAFLTHVGPRVATAPGAIALWTAKVTKYSATALVWGLL